MIKHFTKLLKWLLLAILTCFSIHLYGQNTQLVQGQVTDENKEPLPGVSILIKSSKKGTVSDLNGYYTLNAAPDDVLTLSFIGFKTKEVPVNSRSTIDINLDPDIQELSEVVVIGYGTQEKSHITGSVSRVTNEQLDQIPLSRVDDALVGQVSGVNIQQTNPTAGEEPTIRIRGVSSITGNSNPLIVVDGIAVGSDFLGSIDMNDVESVEVLKDAASSAIYGSRGANGVIMITTKKGKEGPTRFSYNGYVGTKQVPDNDVLSSVDEWTSYVRNNNGELTDEMEYINLLGTQTDWQEVMMDGGVIQSHSISAAGGNEKTRFRAAGSYLEDEGVLLTDNYEKINFRVNVDTKVNDKIKFGLMVNPSYTAQRRFPIGLHDAIRQSPWLPLYIDENNIQYVNRLRDGGAWADVQIGDYAQERMFDNYDLAAGMPVESGGTSISTTSNTNPLAKVLESDDRRTQSKLFTNTYLTYNIIEGLSFTSSLGGDFRYSRNNNWTGTKATRNGVGDTESIEYTSVQTHYVTTNNLSFEKNTSLHSISAILGFAYEQWNGRSSRIEGAGYDFDYIQTIPSTNVTGANTNEYAEALVSYLGRINYAFKDKYLLSVSLRADGSSKFGSDYQYGVFPAFSGGWRVSEENFLKQSDFISNLKLRFSYGTTGNNSIANYQNIGLLGSVGAVFDDNALSVGFNPLNIANPELRWEKAVEINPGIDVDLLGGKFGFGVDYYSRRSRDLLLLQPVPGVTGFPSALVNRGEVENSGVEVEVRRNSITTQSFRWSTTANLSHNVNKVIEFPGGDGLITVIDPKRASEWITQIGSPISSFYGYVMDREIDPQYIKDPYYPINAESQDVYVKDLNGDGVIDTDDRTILGSPYPKLIWSVTNNIKYANFDLSFMFQGSHGAKVRNMDPQYVNNQFAGDQDYTTDFPDADKVVERIFTDDIVMDASYIAMRNLNIGYTIPKNVIGKVGISSARVYVAAQNLIYITSKDYRGYNPEGVYESSGDATSLTYGYQRGAAPIYRSVSLGLNIDF